MNRNKFQNWLCFHKLLVGEKFIIRFRIYEESQSVIKLFELLQNNKITFIGKNAKHYTFV